MLIFVILGVIQGARNASHAAPLGTTPLDTPAPPRSPSGRGAFIMALVLTFGEEDGRSIRGDYAVLRLNGEEVFLHRDLVGAIAGAFAKKVNRRPPFHAALEEEPLAPA